MSDARLRGLERAARLGGPADREALRRAREAAGVPRDWLDGPWLPALRSREALARAFVTAMLRHFVYFASGRIEIDPETGLTAPWPPRGTPRGVPLYHAIMEDLALLESMLGDAALYVQPDGRVTVVRSQTISLPETA